MMVEVTQDDIGWATSAAQHLCHPIDSPAAIRLLADAFARHRIAAEQRGKIEGAWLAIEAVLPEVVTDRTIDAHGAHCRCTTCELNIAEDGIRALDPAKIVNSEP